jgi:hypothetical protein
MLTEMDAWIVALLLAVIMLITWVNAWWLGSRRSGREPNATTKVHDAVLALLGLLLAFTFSMSLVKHEQRRQMAISDSNAIGDFYTCASLVGAPISNDMQRVLREYVQHRLSLANETTDEQTLRSANVEVQRMHSQMESLVKRAVDNGTPVTVPLVNTLNALTSAHAARMAAVRDRLPASIVVLLALAATLSTALVGWQQGLSGERSPGATCCFVLLVCMVVWVTLDLNQPQRGWITISQEPLEFLLQGMDE